MNANDDILIYCTMQPPFSDFESRFLSRISPGTPIDLASSVLTKDTPEYEVILESLRSVRSPTDTSVSTIEIADWRMVSGRLEKLSAAVAALLKLEDGGEALLLATDEGRSLGAELRFSMEVFRDNAR